MKKSNICKLAAACAIAFAAHSVLTNNVPLAIFCTATCCGTLIMGASYERKEQG
jgi:hypothetical protein